MTIVEARQSHEALSSKRDLSFIFGYFGLAICMMANVSAEILNHALRDG